MSRGAKACRSMESSMGTEWASPGPSGSSILVERRGDHCLDAAAHREIPDHRHLARRQQGDQIVQNLVGRRLVEDAAVAEFDEVILERLQLDAPFVGHVRDAYLAEVGQPGLRADGRELGAM